MSTDRKTLKILALIYFVLGILDLAFTGFCFATGSIEPDESLIMGLLAVTGVAALAFGVAGIRGANNPAKAGPAVVTGALVAVVAFATLALQFMNSGDTTELISNAVVCGTSIMITGYAYKVKKEGEDRLS